MEIKSKDQTVNETNQVKPENTTNGNLPTAKADCGDVSIKELFAEKDVQEAIRRHVAVPDVVIVKKVKNAFENKETKTKTQKITVMSGTTIENAVSVDLTLLGTELNPVEAVNKKYRIMEYTFALEANMSAGKFGGYAAKGLKLMVTRLEEVK